jgi:hypothetical protein
LLAPETDSPAADERYKAELIAEAKAAPDGPLLTALKAGNPVRVSTRNVRASNNFFKLERMAWLDEAARDDLYVVVTADDVVTLAESQEPVAWPGIEPA